LLKRIKTVHAGSRQSCGAPRVPADLRRPGEKHSRKRIARLMRDAGLVGASHRHGGPRTTRRNKDDRPAPDPVDRDFSAAGPNHRTEPAVGGRPHPGFRRGRLYVPTLAGFLYLAVVLWLSCSTPGAAGSSGGRWQTTRAPSRFWMRWRWRLASIGPKTSSATAAKACPGAGRGHQYTSAAFGKRCGEAGVRPAMGSVGEAGACPRAGKAGPGGQRPVRELLLHPRSRVAQPPPARIPGSHPRFAPQAEAKMACFSDIEGGSNPVRLHSGLGYRSPVPYEADRQAAMTNA
jgi:putative transposase